MIAIFIFFLLIAAPAQAVVFVASPECPYTGHATCSDGIDNDADGSVDEAAPSAAFAADGVNYRANISDCQALTFATTTDATFASGDYVSKATTTEHWRGELACAGSFTNATYEVFLYYSLPIGPSFIWIKSGTTHGLVPDNAAATVLSQQDTPAWANNTSALTKTGSLANAFTRTNSATALSFALNGAGALFIKSEGGSRLGCIYLRVVGDATAPTCPAETGTGTPGHYLVYKLSGSAPTSCADSQFTNANTWNWVGSSTSAETTPTFQLLHDATKYYACITIPDTELRATTATNDVFPSADDRWEFTWRDSTATTARDATTFKIVVNPLGAMYSANYPSGTASTSQSLSESCTVTLTGDIDGNADDTSFRIFCSFSAGFSLTDGSQLRAEVHVSDSDTAGTTSRTGFGNAINTPSAWGLIDISATQVPGAADVTAPVVTAFAVPAGSIEEQSAVGTAATDEAGTCRVHYGTVTKTYTRQTAGSASVNGLCSEGLGLGGSGSETDPPLTAATEYFAVMKVTDSANPPNTGTSSEVSFTTDAAAPPTCTYYAGPTTAGAADGSSNANRFLIASFWPLALPGTSLCLADGEYTGANSMIAPPSGKKGTSLAPIKVTGTNDGGARINGQGARVPIRLGSDNDWFIIERVDAHASGPGGTDSVVEIEGGSDNNIIRRVVAWDCPLTGNCTVVTVNSGVNNLFEDVAAFGNGRKLFSSSQSGNSNARFRRIWCGWTRTQATNDPKMCLSAWYNSYGTIYDNPIGTWHEDSGSIVNGYNNGVFGSDHFQASPTVVGSCANAGIFGGIAYIRGADSLTTQPVGGEMLGTVWMGQQGHCTTLRDIVSYVEPGTHTAIKSADLRNLTASYGGPLTSANSGNSLNRSTFIGGAAPSIGSNWAQSSNEDVATVGAASNIWNGAGSTGARVCFRYVNGVLTSEKLWPWPMDDRINSALTASGRDPDDYFGTGNTLTDLMESIFGEIPAACKS